jgi:ABC-type dipeptide/oligopeptide/nickel transport system permease component
MIRFAAIRLVEIAVLLALMSFVIYALIGLMPGDPIDLMRSADPRMSAEDVTRLKELYGVDRPLFDFMASIGRYLPATLHGRARRSAANSAIRGCLRRRSRRCCCRGSAIRCC